jgi:hypothetical protein
MECQKICRSATLFLYDKVSWLREDHRLSGRTHLFNIGATGAMDRTAHGLINCKDAKTKCRLYWRLIEFIDWRFSQSCWYLRPSFVSYCLSNLLSGSPAPPPPFLKSKYSMYRQCVAGSGWGVLSCVENHILQEFNILFLTRFRTYEIATTPPSKNLGGDGASDR